MTILYVLIAVLFFGILVIVHELGHFAAAKACNIRVEEFSVGMGPAIFKKQKGETLYAVRAVPFGGYCAMTGEDGESDDPRAFGNQSPWKRLLVLCAGSFMNFVMGYLLVWVFFIGAKAFAAPIIESFMDGCPYIASENAPGFAVGDRILSIDGHRIYMYSDVSDFLAKGNGDFNIVLKRGNEKVRLENYHMVPVEYEGQEKKMYGFNFGYEEATFKTKLRHSWDMTMEFGRWVWMGLDSLFSGEANVSDLSGPVGIVDLMAETGEQAESVSDALFSMVYLGAFIAVNLAMMNMLPIPALDGGRVFLLIVSCVIEKITGRKLDPKYEGYIHGAGMVLLLALMAFIMFNDIVRIITGG